MSFILKRFLLIAGSVSVFGFIISFIPFFHFGSIVSAVTGEPTFLVQPQSVTVSAGQMATLNAVVAGDTPMSYQWYQVNTGYSVIGSTPIPGATGSTYSTPPMYATAQYWLRAQNNLGTVVSQTVTVTVTPTQTSPPVITQHPLGVLIDSGQTATLSVVASGTDPLTYQWYQTGTSGTALIPGATAKIWTTPALTSTTRYFVRVTNTYGTTDSLVATVQVSASIALAPAISQQPQSQTIAAGQTATLSVSATGAQPLGYQWYQVTRGYAVVGSVAIPGATASTYMTAALNATTQYWVQVSNSEGIATSATATVTVTATPTSPPVITEQPHGARIENGQTATLMVTASGTGTLAYQWYEVKNGVNTMIAGAGNNTYNTPPLTVTATYFVRVTNAYGATDSLSATVEVQPVISQAPLITQQPVNQTIATGQTATLSVVAGGGQPLSYQWYQAASNSNLLIPNATGTSYTTPALTATASYFVRVSNSYGMVDSTTVTVTVTQPSMANNAQFLAQSVPAQMAAGQPYSVAVQMKNTGTSTWTTTGSNRFFLSSQNPQDTTTWGYAWQALPGNVAPGEWAIVTFIVTAPAQAGTYNFQWRMVQEAVGWFGETTPNVTVTVGSAAPLAPVIGKQPEVQTVAAGQTAKLGVDGLDFGLFANHKIGRAHV